MKTHVYILYSENSAYSMNVDGVYTTPEKAMAAFDNYWARGYQDGAGQFSDGMTGGKRLATVYGRG